MPIYRTGALGRGVVEAEKIPCRTAREFAPERRIDNAVVCR
jgi:hypothetical protein